MNFGAEHIDLSQVQFTPELLGCIPAEMVRRYRIIPVHLNDGKIGIATADPSDLNTIDTLAHFLNREVEILVTDKLQLNTFIDRFYGH